MQVHGYIVRETEKAVAFVREGGDASKPAWVPLSKIVARVERDDMDRKFRDGKATRVGIPHTLDVDDAFAAKIGL